MRYLWDGYSLDREGTLLTRHGQQVDVSRRLLDCITLLIEQRYRVVSYDELIRKIWGHDDATNHQLAQVIMAARRVLGDDGQTQRLIRTMPGLGFRWVGSITETAASTASLPGTPPDIDAPPTSATPLTPQADDPAPGSLQGATSPDVSTKATSPTATDAAIPPQAPAQEFSSPPQTPTRAPSPHHKRRLHLWISVGLALAVFATTYWWPRAVEVTAAPATAASATADVATATPLAAIEDRLWRGDVEGVRTALVSLPLALAESPESKIIEIRLDIGTGRLERAARKLAKEQAKSKAAGDVVWQARLLILQSLIASKRGVPDRNVFEFAHQAVVLLESLGDETANTVLAEAITAQAGGRINLGQNESAIRDLVRARDILLKENDKRIIIDTRWVLAFARMRTGRLHEALDEFEKIADLCEELSQPVCETRSRNIQARLQIELVRWRDAYATSRRSMEISKEVPDAPTRTYSIRLHALVLTNMGRLREAASLLEATDSDSTPVSTSYVSYLVASGDSELALAASEQMFGAFPSSSNPNLILSSQEGALLLWMIAAQNMAADGRTPPTPSAALSQVLKRPQSIPGRIARGRWLWSRGMSRQAERELRSAIDDSSKANRLLYMVLAAEPLVGLLLQENNVKAAEDVIFSLRGSDPEHMDQDYRVAVLRLRVALAKGDASEIEYANRTVKALAGERSLTGSSPLLAGDK
jgi:DNA-binding winged helix-turn-helix (wHTH) protein/tetratricopeptide (TPR) repeat protein